MAEAEPAQAQPAAEEVQPAASEEVQPAAEEVQPAATEEESKEPAADAQPATGEEEKKEEAPAENDPTKNWDGTPKLSPEEIKRQEGLFTPLQDDLWEWEKTLTDAEREAKEAFEASLRIPDEEEGGQANREAFQKEIDDGWNEVHGDGNGIIDFEQFKVFMMKMNDCAIARGLKAREYSDEEWNMLWTAFNGYNGGNPEPHYEGVTYDDIMYVSRHAAY